MDQRIEARFWAKVDKSKECWEWTAAKFQTGGYGAFRYLGKQQRAHRVSWVLANKRAVPDGMVVRHTCDNPACVRPAHLLLGTHADNVADCVRRGRTLRGVRNHKAKLSEEDVIAIRRSTNSRSALAAEYDVSAVSISYVKLGRTWKHLAKEAA